MDPLLTDKTSVAAPQAGVALTAAALMGIVFGVVIDKGRVFEPQLIRGQLAMQSFVMMKMFLAAAATSLVATGVLASTETFRHRVGLARKWAFSGYRGWPASVAGGLILGAGMALAGACPGTVLVQLGAGVQGAWVTVLGGLCGALAFGLVEPLLQKLGALKCGMFSKAPTFDTLWPHLSFSKIAFAFAGVLYCMVLALEALMPWRKDVGHDGEPILGLTAYPWPPSVSGVVVGLLQFAGLLFVWDTIGASRAYVTVVANVLHRIPGFPLNGYFAGTLSGLGNWQQLVYVVCSVLGGFIGAMLSGTFGKNVSLGALPSFVGGFLVVFGGRCAGGCTSGQGLSGNAVLALNSPLVTAAMFAGGIPVALALTYL